MLIVWKTKRSGIVHSRSNSFSRVNKCVVGQVTSLGISVELFHLGNLLGVVEVLVEVFNPQEPFFSIIFIVILPSEAIVFKNFLKSSVSDLTLGLFISNTTVASTHMDEHSIGVSATRITAEIIIKESKFVSQSGNDRNFVW